MFHPLKVSLEDLYNGKTTKLQLSKNVVCVACKGAGGKQGAVTMCTSCHGRGIKVTMRQLGPGMVQQMQSMCTECRGEGETIRDKDKCKKCNGKKVVKESKILEVHVDKGMSDGQKITFRGESDQEPGVEPGDVIIVVQQKPHDIFKRDHSDLHMTKNIGLAEALCGFQMVVKHLDGRDLLIKYPAGKVIEADTLRLIEGEGMPTYRRTFDKGDLYVKFKIEFPDNNFLDESRLKTLETHLPTRPTQPTIPQESEEVYLMAEADSRGSDSQRREAYHEEDSDDDENGSHVRCAQQ